MSTTTYTTTIDFDYRAKRDNGRKNNTRERMSTRECYMRDVMALENVEPKKKKGTLAKTAGRGGGFGRAGCRSYITSIKNFLKKIVYNADTTSIKNPHVILLMGVRFRY